MVTWREAISSPSGNPDGNGPGRLLATQREMVTRLPAGHPEEDGSDRLLVTRKEMVQVACWRPGGRWSMSPSGDPDSGDPEREGLGFSRKLSEFCLMEDCFVKKSLSQKPSTVKYFRSFHA
ncbi:hypothetical protein Rs2_21437 [Raphanus sativus]|nr:hypothetical protein Rs2_21437 [Raphanus sativus]